MSCAKAQRLLEGFSTNRLLDRCDEMLKELYFGFFDWVNEFAHDITEAIGLELNAGVYVPLELLVVLYE